MHRCSRGRPKCSLLVHSRDVISLMKPAFVWLGFRGPDCNVIAEQGGGPDALGLRGPDLARGPEVARLCVRQSRNGTSYVRKKMQRKYTKQQHGIVNKKQHL